ncbi:MAG: hypothetical protein WCS77_00820 [Elusimicrobiaceae bacterium]
MKLLIHFVLFAGLMSPCFSQVLVCPAKNSDETKLDCPWAGIVRLMDDTAKKKKPFLPILKKHAPGIVAQLERDGKDFMLPRLWGSSQNFDENSKQPIVDEQVLGALFTLARSVPARGRVVPAGITHTYGYLFSNLKTPYGYKRARWVQPDIEKGLGLPDGCLGPKPSSGTLLGNVTYFIGRIAFRDDAHALQLLERLNAPAMLTGFDFGGLEIGRLSETAKIAERTVVLRTDIVTFKNPQKENAALLVYSVKDSQRPFPQLISAFPVSAKTADDIMKTAAGSDITIKTRYNAFVLGLSETPVPGTVEISSATKTK